ncbi:Fungal specific transcription factor domain-containing protein isoform 2 [Cladophialophora immunda]|nr:Fungal specific transcription factor domain-containing protein isoform 1 [Cladophialophora immunda]OQU94075.1 Fungal specific transcription factor domain-containing protein isoform 2 [Cladophialophora immunda]
MKDIYADRVDPVMKILHIPTFWSSLTNALQHPQETPNSLKAAMFGFCLATVSALDDDECQSLLGGPRPAMLARYRTIARQALMNAGFPHTSSVMTLRAFSLFLIGVRTSLRHDTQYILSGVAVRLALKMGLHRDGESLGLSLFETEMRRRLWWHIVHIDFRAADMLGMRPCRDLSIGDTKVPLNVEDEEFGPDMVEPPLERGGITSIVLCLVRCDIIEFLRKLAPPLSNGVHWDTLTSPDITTAKKDGVISQMEDLWERKYLRYCDPSNPLHTFASIMMRSCICKMKLLAHSPRRRIAGRRVKIPQTEREIVFANATKLLEYAVLVRGNQGLQKYAWRTGTSYLWDTMLCVLIEARHRKPGPDVDRLWQLIGVVLSQHPEAFKESTGAVYIALCKWTLEAWEDYVAATKSDGLPEPMPPEYINAIRNSWTSRARPALLDQDYVGPGKLQSGVQDRNPPQAENFDCYNFPDLVSFETDPNEWIQWEQLLSGQNGFGEMEHL